MWFLVAVFTCVNVTKVFFWLYLPQSCLSSVLIKTSLSPIRFYCSNLIKPGSGRYSKSRTLHSMFPLHNMWKYSLYFKYHWTRSIFKLRLTHQEDDLPWKKPNSLLFAYRDSVLFGIVRHDLREVQVVRWHLSSNNNSEKDILSPSEKIADIKWIRT